MARVVSVADDLMLASRVDAMLTAAGHHVVLARSLQASSALDGAELIVADLDASKPEALVGLGMPVLGYYSHVDVETRQAAMDAGVDMVVPRSRMSRELPALVEGLLAEG